MTTLGIDIGGSSVKVAGVRDGATIFRGQSQTYHNPSAEGLIHAIRDVLRSHRAMEDFHAAGICVPGLLDESGRKVMQSVNVPGLNGVSLHELVALSIGTVVPVDVVNDATAAAVDIVATREFRRRAAIVALGTGVGLAVMDGGKPLHVEGSSPGHIGQVDVSLPGEAPIGPDGGAGSLEAYVGAPALISAYGSTDAFLRSADVTAPPIQALVRAIRIIHAIYRPENIILAGGIGIRLKPLVPQIKSQVDTRLTSIARANWLLDSAVHDFHAAIGAAVRRESSVTK